MLLPSISGQQISVPVSSAETEQSLHFVPRTVNQKAGSVVGSPNMNCSEIFLRDPLASLFHIPAVMLSDCKAGAVGEYFFGGADTAHTLVYLTISTGLGCGVIANGSLLTGADGNAGEVGHIVVDTRYNRTHCCRYQIQYPLRLRRYRPLGSVCKRYRDSEIFPCLVRRKV